MMTPASPYQRVLLSRMKFVGDVVLTTPLIRSIRNALPDAYIAYLGEKNAVSLLEGNPALDEIIPFDFGKPTILEQPRVAWTLRRRGFDLAIDLFGNPRSALLTYLSGAKTRVGPLRKGRGSLYTIQVEDDGTPKSAVAFHNQFLRAAGITPASDKMEIHLSDDERREARIYLQWLDHEQSPLDMAKPLVGIHAGASWPAKIWLAERFAQLADSLKAKLGVEVILVAGPKDMEATQQVLSHAAGNIKVVSNLPLRQLAAIISQCSVFVANDAGPMHIAAALHVPTIGLFGPGEEKIWFPYDKAAGHTALRKDVPCHPCHLDFCNREGEGYMECMKLLHVDEVFNTVANALRRKG